MLVNISCVKYTGEQDGNISWADMEREQLTGKDASWILTTAVIIFTMQTGFGLLEAGGVSSKSEVNIMMKNALDVVFGGITYWAFGFGLSFGASAGANPFIGIGCFFVDANDSQMGYIFAVFLFQLSFATTSTTVVSGAMCERARLSSYIVFSLLNTFIYSVPAHWLWSDVGFLYTLGAVDVAGCAPVHLVGGATGLVATLMLGPRTRAFARKRKPPLPAPLKSILGLFMLWWGWLRFSSGSVFMMSADTQWKGAVRAGVTTIVASMSGGITAVVLSLLLHCAGRSSVRYDIGIIVGGVLSSLVSITGICTICKPWESLLIGSLGAAFATMTDLLLYRLRVDDPVGVVPVHCVCGAWGLLAVGLFIEPKDSHIEGQGGLLKTGQWYMLGVQAATVAIVLCWSMILSALLLKLIDLSLGLRLTKEEEELGIDYIEHGIKHTNGRENSLSAFLRIMEDSDTSITKENVENKPVSGEQQTQRLLAYTQFLLLATASGGGFDGAANNKLMLDGIDGEDNDGGKRTPLAVI